MGTRRIGVVGAGNMGSGIAQKTATADTIPAAIAAAAATR